MVFLVILRRKVSMKLHSCFWICALVAFFSVSNGQSHITEYSRTQNPLEETKASDSNTTSQNALTTVPTSTVAPTYTDSSENDFSATQQDYNVSDSGPNNRGSEEKEEEHEKNRGDNATTTVGTTTEYVTTTTAATTVLSGTEAKAGSSSWGYVILLLIILLSFALCIILFYMRRVSRTYSFDLQRPAPSRLSEPIGTFEPVYLDDLDHQIHTVEHSTLPEANGTALSTEDKEPNGEAPQDEPQTNGLQTLVTPDSSPSAQTEADQDQDQARPGQDHLAQELFIEERNSEMNENNNNPSVRSSDPFVEINLDEPQPQIFTFPQTALSSSVQPFSPFSFSSSSS